MRLTEFFDFLSKKNLTSEWIRLHYTHYELCEADRKYKEQLYKKEKEQKFKQLDLFKKGGKQ